jgi:protein SCO1/2
MIARRYVLPLVLFTAGVMLFGGLVIWWAGSRNTTGATALGGAFELQSHDGRVVTDKDLLGHPSVIFFGYTHCPDVCPTALFEMTQVYQALGKEADRLNTYFITVDPERDDKALLSVYLSSFDPHITGLTGTPEQIQKAIRAYRVYARKVEDKSGSYVMDHTALVYLMDRQGRFVSSLNLDRAPEETAKQIRSYF